MEFSTNASNRNNAVNSQRRSRPVSLNTDQTASQNVFPLFAMVSVSLVDGSVNMNFCTEFLQSGFHIIGAYAVFGIFLGILRTVDQVYVDV